MSVADVAARIQHTNVRPETTRRQIEQLVTESLEHRFQGVMVNPIWAPLAARLLEGSGMRVCTAFDFPMGGSTTEVVAQAVAQARRQGADEVDVMTKPGWLRSGMHSEYQRHLAEVVAAADGAPVKAMLEAGLLEDEELRTAVELCAEAGVSFLKNSSGYGGGDATPELVRRLVELAAGRMGVKASGGIRTRESAEALLEAGADLLGSSSGVAIVSGGRGEAGY
ncbi:MAG: deoxyribose-phosphate aldolase [Actinomycetota bacterium]|nr:deoxyribose-phosphate aldolase [Actinomycetota bacterium]